MSALSDALNEANVDQLSVREIARRGSDRVHHSALGKYFKPDHPRPSEEVLEVFSEVLRIPMPRLRQLASLPAGEGEAYEPPREANRLDRRQRRLVDELIRMLAEAKVGDGDVGRDATPMKLAARSVGRPPSGQEPDLSDEERAAQLGLDVVRPAYDAAQDPGEDKNPGQDVTTADDAG